MGLHINPLRKKKKVLAPEPDTKSKSNEENKLMLNGGTPYEKGITPDENDEHMTYREAAIVALIITLFQLFASFLTLYDWSKVTANPMAFIFDLVKFAGASFFGSFIALSGIAKYLSK